MSWAPMPCTRTRPRNGACWPCCSARRSPWRAPPASTGSAPGRAAAPGRRRGELPHRRPITTLGTDLVLDAGYYPGLFEAAVSEAERLGYRREVRHSRQQWRATGLGVAAFLEKAASARAA